MFKIPASTLFLGKNLVYLPECASTNTYANELTIKSEVPEGTVVVTNRQFLGRGQRGNTWESAEGQNLTFSIVLYPRFLKPADQYLLAKSISLAVVDALVSVGIPDAMIKWPNDIIINDKKVCGILIEGQVRGQELGKAIVGIGLNVNQVIFNTTHATSIALATGRAFDLNEMLSNVLRSAERRYTQLKNDPSSQRPGYIKLLYWRGEKHLFESAGKAFEGTIEDVDESGRLCVSTGGKVKTFGVKEIAYVK